MNLSQNPICEKTKSICNYLSAIKLKSDYDVNLSITNDNTPEKDEATHSLTGSSECNLLKLIGAVALISVSACAISSVCSLFKD